MNDPHAPKEPLGRRHSHRVPLKIGATLASGGRPVPGRLINLSQGGALFEYKQRRSVLPGPCILKLTVAGTTDHQLSIPIDIVRTGRGQFGVEWRQPLPEDVGALSFLLKG